MSLICSDKYILFSERGTNTLSFVYDHASQSSVTIHGVEDPTTGNGGCVKVKITDSPVTVIIRESLGATGLIQDNCSGTSYYTSSCPVMLDAPVVLNKTFYTGSGVVYADDISNSSSPATINGTTVPKGYSNVPISFICNNLAEYMVKNYGRTAFYKVAEFVSSDPNESSYCAISFVPRNDSDLLKVGINSSLLDYNDQQAQPKCEGTDFDQKYECSLPISINNEKNCIFIPGKANNRGLGGVFCNRRCKKTTDTNGNSSYLCKYGSYTCQFQTIENQGAETVTGGRCSFNTDLVFESQDFYCGFCTKAEMQTVGNSGYYIESGDSGDNSSGVGLPGYVYPFNTLGKNNPGCFNGLMADLE